MINDFIEEIEVITGGYNAEYGRATGGIVNVVTKRGTNEFGLGVRLRSAGLPHRAARTRRRVNASSIDVTGDIAYDGDFGFELGGPIIKDKPWFFVGFAPQLSRTDYTRTTKRQTDCRVRIDDGKLLDVRAQRTPTARPTSIRRPASTSPTRSTREVRSATSRSTQLARARSTRASTPKNQGQLSA